MSYQVLARKWRPRTFQAMAGQEHVLRALINGLDNGRLHHAYLFTGTRGVGKTTVARILAKCLNCETKGVTAEPCGECGACREIDEGRFVDLIEVDAASRTKVEDTRDLLDNVQYAPTRGRYKVYLIDEVHMLSSHSFNALLKTLEEPPEHVKFLLATTDPQKLPVTILSRCLQFNLKRLPVDLIAGHLQRVLESEGIQAEPAAIQRVAHAADGSMRDALSLLDQAIAYGGGALQEAEVRAMLGSIERDFVFDLLEALAGEDGPTLLEVIARMAEQAPDFGEALAELLTVLHRLAIAKTVPEAAPGAEDPDAERLLAISGRLSAEDVQLFYQIGLNGRRDLQWAPDPRLGFEMILLRMLAFRPAGPEEGAGRERSPVSQSGRASQPVSPPARAEPSAGPGATGGDRGAAQPTEAAPAPAPRVAEEPQQPVPTVAAQAPASGPAQDGDGGWWSEVVSALPVSGMAHALALHCQWVERDTDQIRLRISPGHEHLLNRSMSQRLEKALGEYFEQSVRLDIEVTEVQGTTPADVMAAADARRRHDAEQSIQDDPNISALRDAFDAELIPDSIEPLND